MIVDRKHTRKDGFSGLNLFDRGIVDSAILVIRSRRVRAVAVPIVAIIVVAAGSVAVVVALNALRETTIFSKVTETATIVAWLLRAGSHHLHSLLWRARTRGLLLVRAMRMGMLLRMEWAKTSRRRWCSPKLLSGRGGDNQLVLGRCGAG